MARHLTIPCEKFDPLAIFTHLYPEGPGFLETLNPLPKTGRYSVVPLRVKERYVLSQQQLYCLEQDQQTLLPGDPFDALENILASYHQECSATPFPGGFFGYFSYDLAASIEQLPQQAHRDLPTPDLDLYWVDVTAVYDHTRKELTIATLADDVDLGIIIEQIEAIPTIFEDLPVTVEATPQPIISKETFMVMVEQGKEYIAAGDVYQVNLSCRFDGRISGSSTQLYRHLRQLNPSPFACYLNFPGLEIISSSPERLVCLNNEGLAETRPIAGTRPRGFSPPQDHQLGKELLGDPKEQAEHIMLIDLERNDLGKVCQGGTVEVDELMVLERYSHVTHIVSNVRGQLNEDCGPLGLLRATFPGGTITGVPKKRCMEIIDELEPVGRGSYTGSAGYISVTGVMDLNILIRSFQRFNDILTYQTGAGIVADSIPENEWYECLAKGEAMRTVLEQVKG